VLLAELQAQFLEQRTGLVTFAFAAQRPPAVAAKPGTQRTGRRLLAFASGTHAMPPPAVDGA
jgi:hypothetical protein